MKKYIFLIALFIIHSFGSSAFAGESIVIKAAREELNRAMKELGEKEYPPYFISYGISEKISHSITASFGKIKIDKSNKTRTLDIDLRIGSREFDNTHIIRGNPFSFSSSQASTKLPIENNKEALRNAIWYTTDKNYKKSTERYEKALTNKAVKVEEEDLSNDMSLEQASKYIGETSDLKLDAEYWRERLKRLSALFLEKDWMYHGSVNIRAVVTNKYFVSTEGTVLQWSEPSYRVFISAQTKADDGMSLPMFKSYFAFSADELADEKTMAADVKKTIEILEKMREAPLMSIYSGPALLSGDAAGVFFHEIFGHRIEGQRLKNPNDAQTFKNSVGEEVLPEFLDVIMDPNKKQIRSTPLGGYYQYDDEGIKGQTVEVVKNGVFKNFLMSRSPIEGFDKSNGHGRRAPGYKAVSRQSNLLVISHKTVPVSELKEKLRKELKKEDKEFGLYFVKVQGGFTFTGRSIPNSFNVNPILVYKVFADGRPDEMVRGVDLIGTPLTTFSNIIAAGDDMEVFNGVCGAESGGVPVSAVSPTLLVSKIEVQKKKKSQAKPPILPAPEAAKEN